MINELDVLEVLEGHPAPPSMSSASRREAIRQLDARSVRRRTPVLSHREMAARFGVTAKTVERDRALLRREGQVSA